MNDIEKQAMELILKHNDIDPKLPQYKNIEEAYRKTFTYQIVVVRLHVFYLIEYLKIKFINLIKKLFNLGE